jgi:hypothetical protein
MKHILNAFGFTKEAYILRTTEGKLVMYVCSTFTVIFVGGIYNG